MEEISITGDSFASHETEVVNLYNGCTDIQANYHRESEKLKRLREIENSIDSSATSIPSLPESDCKLDRWTCIAELLCKQILSDQQSKEVVLTVPILNELFNGLCIFGTPTLRKLVGKLIKLQIQNNCWPSFLSTMLKKYFSTSRLSMGPLNMFPSNEVYLLLEQVAAENAFSAFEDLFTLLSTLVDPSEVRQQPEKLDLALVSWNLSLVSNIMIRQDNQSFSNQLATLANAK